MKKKSLKWVGLGLAGLIGLSVLCIFGILMLIEAGIIEIHVIDAGQMIVIKQNDTSGALYSNMDIEGMGIEYIGTEPNLAEALNFAESNMNDQGGYELICATEHGQAVHRAKELSEFQTIPCITGVLFNFQTKSETTIPNIYLFIGNYFFKLFNFIS